jgi:hypothetical protein
MQVSEGEKLLIDLLSKVDSLDTKAMVLQSFIQEVGLLSEAAAAEVRKLLGEKVKEL